ncbi:sodium/hydrogen exchanger 2-like, partial [Trifolium medium]|nr:sodium/hydrogen exchanger 2-like [Trifolium medium]
MCCTWFLLQSWNIYSNKCSIVGSSTSWKSSVIIWWAGLMRGAVSMALAYNQFTRSGHTQLRSNAIMITSTITVVLFSTVSLALVERCHANMFITDDNLHLTIRFCKVELDSIQNSKMVSEPPPRSVG